MEYGHVDVDEDESPTLEQSYECIAPFCIKAPDC